MDAAAAMRHFSARTVCRCERCKPAWLRVWDALLDRFLDEQAAARRP